MKVIVVEDDRIYQAVVKKELEMAGHTVIVSNNGIEALEIIKKQKIRMAIIDWIMPGMDGISLSREIRKLNLHRYVYFIILTAKSNKKDVIEALDAGADDYISKPHDREELISRLKVGRRILDLEDKLIKSQKKLIKLAREDPLTNLLNRRSFLDEALNELDRAMREEHLISTIMADIDSFKNINDTYGHQIGDGILIEFARRLESVCRPYDKLGRYGGEEFLILLPHTKPSNAVKIAKRMRVEIKKNPFNVMGEKITITSSFGVSVLTPDNRPRDDQIEDLVKRTDLALYKAKRDGKNRVAVNTKT